MNAEHHNHAQEPRDGASSPEEVVELNELRQQLDRRMNTILTRLCERDRRIINEHFRGGTATTTRLGDELGISRQRVAQIVKRVARQLKQELAQVAEH